MSISFAEAAARPHGGTLVDRLIPREEIEAWRAQASSLPTVQASARTLADVECIATGAYSPLTGFLARADYTAVLEDLRLAGGEVWSLPITLPVDAEDADAIARAGGVALADSAGRIIGTVGSLDVWAPDKQREAVVVYGTDDASHPGVAALYASGDVYIGGPLAVPGLPADVPFPERRLTPLQTRDEIAARGWRTVVGFQTRNPVHRAHEYLQKIALEQVDGLLLHPLVGETKDDDVPAGVRMRCYETLLARYYPADRVFLSVFPGAMRYAGPREAIVHALARKNYGCTHFIVGRDHAGVGNHYGPYDAQRIFDRFAPDEIGITILPFENAFWCHTCIAMATRRTCPHDPSQHVALSGTAVRQMLTDGVIPPPEFSREEVARVLIDAYQKEIAR